MPCNLVQSSEQSLICNPVDQMLASKLDPFYHNSKETDTCFYPNRLSGIQTERVCSPVEPSFTSTITQNIDEDTSPSRVRGDHLDQIYTI